MFLARGIITGDAEFLFIYEIGKIASSISEGKFNLLQVNTYSADVKNVGSIRVAIEAAVKDSGFIEVLILSHGVSCVLTFEDGTVEDYDHVIDTNLKGNIYTLKAALPHIKANGGPASICMLSSQAGQVRLPPLD